MVAIAFEMRADHDDNESIETMITYPNHQDKMLIVVFLLLVVVVVVVIHLYGTCIDSL